MLRWQKNTRLQSVASIAVFGIYPSRENVESADAIVHRPVALQRVGEGAEPRRVPPRLDRRGGCQSRELDARPPHECRLDILGAVCLPRLRVQGTPGLPQVPLDRLQGLPAPDTEGERRAALRRIRGGALALHHRDDRDPRRTEHASENRSYHDLLRHIRFITEPGVAVRAFPFSGGGP